MNLRMLNAFRAVVETGSVTRAALQLHITQPAVSRIVADLEGELGFKLFERVKKRFVLTAEGQAFFTETERLLMSFDGILEAARDIREGRLSRVRIVSMPAAAHGLLPDALAVFQKSHPRVSISVDVRRRSEVTRWVAGRQFDIGVASLPINYPGISTRPIASTFALAAVPNGHPLARKKMISASDLASERLIGLSADSMIQDRINQHLTKLGQPANLTIDTSSLLAVCHYVAGGLGCGIVDLFTAHAVGTNHVEFRKLEPALEIVFGLVFIKDHPPSPQIESLCEEIERSAVSISQSWESRNRAPVAS